MDLVKVGIAEYGISTNGTRLKTTGLGSCVGIALRDADNDVSGLLHIMLPSSDEVNDDNELKFADTGLETMIDEMSRRGADPENVEAKIAGGSEMFQFSSDTARVGQRNVEAVIEALEEHGIPLLGKDVGGDHGRTLTFHPESGELRVKSAKKGTRVL